MPGLAFVRHRSIATSTQHGSDKVPRETVRNGKCERSAKLLFGTQFRQDPEISGLPCRVITQAESLVDPSSAHQEESRLWRHTRLEDVIDLALELDRTGD